MFEMENICMMLLLSSELVQHLNACIKIVSKLRNDCKSENSFIDMCIWLSVFSKFISKKLNFPCVLIVQENYLGEDQKYTDFYDTPGAGMELKEDEGLQGPLTDKEVAEREFDPRKYRPFAVVVSVTLHDIQAHLVKVNISN